MKECQWRRRVEHSGTAPAAGEGAIAAGGDDVGVGGAGEDGVGALAPRLLLRAGVVAWVRVRCFVLFRSAWAGCQEAAKGRPRLRSGKNAGEGDKLREKARVRTRRLRVLAALRGGVVGAVGGQRRRDVVRRLRHPAEGAAVLVAAGDAGRLDVVNQREVARAVQRDAVLVEGLRAWVVVAAGERGLGEGLGGKGEMGWKEGDGSSRAPCAASYQPPQQTDTQPPPPKSARLIHRRIAVIRQLDVEVLAAEVVAVAGARQHLSQGLHLQRGAYLANTYV